MPERRLPLNSPRDTRSSFPLIPTRRSLAVGIWSALLVSDAVVIARCLSGEWVAPLPPLLAVVSMIAVAAASHLAWLAFQAHSRQTVSNEISHWVPLGVSLAASALWCLALVTQAAPLTSGLLAGVILFQWLTALATVEPQIRGEIGSPVIDVTSVARKPASGQNRPDDNFQYPTLVETPIPDSFEPEPIEFEPVVFDSTDSDGREDEDITQWMSRRMTDDGEVIEGWLRVTFFSGQREATIHVSFCPPLAGSPEIETEDLEGADLEIRTASVFPFGLRMIARRSGSTQELQVARIGFVATAAANRRAA